MRRVCTRKTIGTMAVMAAVMIGCSATSNGSEGKRSDEPIAEPNTTQDSVVPEKKKELKPSVCLAFVGDVMMGTNFPTEATVTKDRGKTLFRDCSQYLQDADLAIANLEGVLYSGNYGRPTKSLTGKYSYMFRMPGDHVQNLVNAGIDAVGIANNHANDFDLEGRQKTMETLDSAGIKYSGQQGLAEETYIERDGVKYGYLAFAASCTRAKSLDMLDKEMMKRFVAKVRPQCDVLIVTFHGGAEGRTYTHVPRKTETFIGENRGNVYQFAHDCIDEGVDIVVGHGPHVPRGMELYKGHLIAYSLGNFCTPYRINLAGVSGYAPLLCANINPANGEFIDGNIYSYIQAEGVGPRTDANHSVARLMKDLSKTDFPESKLDIQNDGTLCVK